MMIFYVVPTLCSAVAVITSPLCPHRITASHPLACDCHCGKPPLPPHCRKPPSSSPITPQIRIKPEALSTKFSYRWSDCNNRFINEVITGSTSAPENQTLASDFSINRPLSPHALHQLPWPLTANWTLHGRDGSVVGNWESDAFPTGRHRWKEWLGANSRHGEGNSRKGYFGRQGRDGTSILGENFV
ncbi:hypothetical protein Acr_00g0074370 [Actinidia rufa]|uniref:Uncharacterized protein n=1 Tax=Actinidia rufa TaxID=165716 RepID=A0A7J0DSI6_9ERIC|nr:hypothetical protein Acr_00g0074370 [Actinidia rufa]